MPDLLDMHIFDQKASRKTESFLYTACLRTKPCLAIQKSKKTMCFNSRPELDNMPCHIKRVIFPRAAYMLPSLAPSTALQYRKYLHYQKLLKQEWFHRSTITILLERFHRIRSQGPTKSFLQTQDSPWELKIYGKNQFTLKRAVLLFFKRLGRLQDMEHFAVISPPPGLDKRDAPWLKMAVSLSKHFPLVMFQLFVFFGNIYIYIVEIF